MPGRSEVTGAGDRRRRGLGSRDGRSRRRVAGVPGRRGLRGGGAARRVRRWHRDLRDLDHRAVREHRPERRQLFAHWSCDPSVDPATRYQGAHDALWTSVDGVTGQGVLRTQASCPSGALLTVQVDAAARVDTIQTRLACEISNADGDRVAEETVTCGLSTDDPVCRVPVP